MAASEAKAMTKTNEALVEVHGVSPEHTEEQGIAVGRAMLIVLGALGRIPAKEMDRFVEIATEYGASPSVIHGWRRFNYADARLEEQIEMTPRLARHLMYDAVRIVRAAAPPGPSAKLTAVARVLGVPKAVVASLDGLVTAENALRDAYATVESSAAHANEVPSRAVAGLRALTDQATSLRTMRIKLLDEETGLSR